MTSRKKEIKQLIAHNKKKEAITALLAILEERTGHFSPDHIQQYEETLILLSARLESNKELIDQGTALVSTTNVEANKIRIILLGFVNSLSKRFWEEDEPNGKVQNEQQEVREIPIFQLGEATYEYDVFLCHSDADAAFAEGIYEELKLNGLNVFYSKETLKRNSGDSFFEKISHGLEHSEDFILVCSPAAMQSEWVKVEYETFFSEYHLKDAKNRNFYVLQGPAYDIAQVPVLLKRLQIAEEVQSILKSKAATTNVAKEKNRSNLPDTAKDVTLPIEEDSKVRKIIILLIAGLVIAGFFLLKMCQVETDEKEPEPYLLDFYNAEIELSKDIAGLFNLTSFVPGNGTHEEFQGTTNLLIKDQDLLLVNADEKEAMIYLFDKRDSFNPLKFDQKGAMLYLNDNVVSIQIPIKDSLQERQFLDSKNDFPAIDFIELIDTIPMAYCAQLEKMAKKKPGIGFLFNLNSERMAKFKTSCLAYKFMPEILHCDYESLIAMNNSPFLDSVKTLVLDCDNVIAKSEIQINTPNLQKLSLNHIDNESLKNIDYSLLANNKSLTSLAVMGDGRMEVGPIAALNQLNDLSIFTEDTIPDVRPLLRLSNLKSLSLLGNMQNAGFINRMNPLKRLSLTNVMTQSNFDQILGTHVDLEFLEIFLYTDTLKNLQALKGLPRLKGVGILEYENVKNTKVDLEFFMELDSLKYLTIPKAIYDDEKNAHLISKFRNSGRIVVPNAGICLGSGWLLLLPLSILFFLLLRLVLTIVKRKWMNFS